MNAVTPAQAEALVGSTALTPAGADAELLAACAAFDALEREMQATFPRGMTLAEESVHEDRVAHTRNRILLEQDVLLGTITAHPAMTTQGAVAVARSLDLWDRDLLKPHPTDCADDVLTRTLVAGLVTMLPPSDADAGLIAACSEFRASEAAYCDIYDEPGALTQEQMEAAAEPILASWDGLLDEMAAARATTMEGLAARALVLAQHSGIKPGSGGYPFAFDPESDDVTGRLLHMLLRDAVAMSAAPGYLEPGRPVHAGRGAAQ